MEEEIHKQAKNIRRSEKISFVNRLQEIPAARKYMNWQAVQVWLREDKSGDQPKTQNA